MAIRKQSREREGNSRALSGATSYLSAEGSEQRATMLYTGAMEKGQMHGKGALVYPNSEKYEVRGRRRVRPKHVAEKR